MIKNIMIALLLFFSSCASRPQEPCETLDCIQEREERILARDCMTAMNRARFDRP